MCTSMVIFVLVELLFQADIIRALEFEVKPLEIGTSGTIPCDHQENGPEVRVVQWYKSMNIAAFENGNPSLASWPEGVTESLKNYHMENTTFSLVIEKATLEDEGLYKCSVEIGDLFDESYYYTRTVMYALPRMDPEIIIDHDLNRVNCTVEHVKPLIYPVINFDYSLASAETYAVLNDDGTYTTSVCCALPQTKSALRVGCSFSYLHYHGVSSFDLHGITTDSPMENIATTGSPMDTSVSSADDGFGKKGHAAYVVLGIVIGLETVACFILLIILTYCRGKFHRGVQNYNRANDSEAMIVTA